jgi:biopolymer transport protein ExbD
MRTPSNLSRGSVGFNMTPMIDVVFLLIIFFMLVSRFISENQFNVSVPDQIQTVSESESDKGGPLTITVGPDQTNEPICMVGSQRLAMVNGKEMAILIESAVNDALSQRKSKDKTVRLRCDKSIPFGLVKYILAGVSKSRAENLEWAVLKN